MFLYLQAFFDLGRERPIGLSEGPIPRKAVNEYAEEYEFDDEQRDLLKYVVGEMDQAYLKLRNKKPKADPPRKVHVHGKKR